MVFPGCQLNATWPRNFGDVVWGSDNCLYEADGTTLIRDQCAQPVEEGDVGEMPNPYYSEPVITTTSEAPADSDPTPDPVPVNPFPVCDGVDIPSLTCNKDCCGWVPCPDWCIANCGGLVC